jgi:hypothetical protein
MNLISSKLTQLDYLFTPKRRFTNCPIESAKGKKSMATSAKTAKVKLPALIYQLRGYYGQREDSEEPNRWREVPNELYSDTVSMLSLIVRSMLHGSDGF